MNRSTPFPSGEQTIATMIELARCNKLHRIIVAGSMTPEHMFTLHRRGYARVATSATAGLPRGQYDVALVDWQHSIKALETTLDWLVHFLASSADIFGTETADVGMDLYTPVTPRLRQHR